jgi:hypothetical protein
LYIVTDVSEKLAAFVCRVVQEELSSADRTVLHRKWTRNMIVGPMELAEVCRKLEYYTQNPDERKGTARNDKGMQETKGCVRHLR